MDLNNYLFKSTEYPEDPTDLKMEKSQTLKLPFVSIVVTVQIWNTDTEYGATGGFRHLAPINYISNNQMCKKL